LVQRRRDGMPTPDAGIRVKRNQTLLGKSKP
jgi:hypothetical protein